MERRERYAVEIHVRRHVDDLFGPPILRKLLSFLSDKPNAMVYGVSLTMTREEAEKVAVEHTEAKYIVSNEKMYTSYGRVVNLDEILELVFE